MEIREHPSATSEANRAPTSHAAPTEQSKGLINVTDIDGLHAIHQESCQAVVWQRTLAAAFYDWINTLPAEQLPSLRKIVHPAKVREIVRQACDMVSMPDCTQRALFIDDITALADTYAEVMNPPFIRVRLDVITDNACTKFHIDAVRSRLICTYRGTGTQIGFRTSSRDEPESTHTVPTASPVVLRGTLWPTQTPTLLHRSPPIAGTGETRLLLVLDPVDKSDNN